ncbi:MAG: lipopolysaccharide biosynthesis protein [Hyphomonadaceae bacterium]
MKLAALTGAAPLQIAQGLIGLGAIAAFTRLLTPEEFGLYALALSLSMLAHTVAFTWAEAAAYRFYARAAAEGRLTQHFALLRRLCAGTAAVFMLAAGCALLFAQDPRVASIIAFAAPSAVLRFYVRIGRESERAAQMPLRMAAMETLYVALGLAAGVGFLLTFDLGAAAPFAGLALAGALVWLLGSRPPANMAAPEPSGSARAYADYGAPLAAALAVDLGVQALTRMVLADAAGLSSLGAYAAAFGLARPLDMIFLWAAAALTPAIMAAYEQQGAEAARTAARRAFELLAAIACPAALGLAMIGAPLSRLLVGEALATDAAVLLPWLAASALASGFGLYYWSEAFQLARRTGLRALVMLAPGAVQLMLTLLLAPRMGASGAAIAACAAACVGALMLALVGRHLIALPLPAASLARIALACAPMAGVLLLAPTPQSPLQLCFIILCAGSAYAFSAFLLNIAGVRAVASVLSQALSGRMRARFQTLFTEKADGRAR